jgi:uncharacterized protein YdhG (YjbR/CyaY superfamily)
MKNETSQVSSQRRTYFASLPPDSRKSLKEVREAIRAAAPDAIEHFSYGIPGFRLDGKSLIWYAAFKNHFSLYPMTATIKRVHAKELERYEVSKGTIRFPVTKPPSSALVKRLVKTRIAEIRQESKK